MDGAPDEFAAPPRVLAMRERFLAETPPGYRPRLHLAMPLLVGLPVIAWCVAGLQGPGLSDMLVVPLTWLAAVATEWRIHRDLLHRRVWPVQFLYDAHTVSHHAMYVEGAMEISRLREVRGILFPPWATAASAVGTAPLAGLIALVLGGDAGRLFWATALAYLIMYEALHLAFHLPRRHPIRRLWVIERLARNHTRHHDPRRMQRKNFGVTTALWDRVRGTLD
jgi:sterol desaturase/sphingolipid hydroxylase (fatty acid hydroxylase superfamily)